MTPKPSKEAMEAAQAVVDLTYKDRGHQVPHRDDIAVIIDRAISARASHMEALAMKLNAALRREASTIGNMCTLCGGRANLKSAGAESHDPRCPARPWAELIGEGE